MFIQESSFIAIKTIAFILSSCGHFCLYLSRYLLIVFFSPPVIVFYLLKFFK